MKGDGNMFVNVPLLIWTFAYPIIGYLVSNYVAKYIKNLEDKVAEINPRYCKLLWINVSVKKTRFNKWLADIIFGVFWPIVVIASVIKAEWWYDSIMHRNVYRKG